MSSTRRTDALLALAIAAMLSSSTLLFAQTAPSMTFAPATAPATAPGVTLPASLDGVMSMASSAPATMATPATSAYAPRPTTMAAELPAVTQAFVASVTADKVYVRSGPATTYYELGQLSKNDMVYVVGTSKGWYKILPPNGTFCLIAKEFVEVDAAGTSGTVKGDYINVRAGTAINRNRDPFAVLNVIRKGTKLNVVGSNDKYYEVAPPEGTYVYISPQYLAKSSAEYKVPDLKLPAGAVAPAQVTVTAPATLPPATIELPSITTSPPATGPVVVEPGAATTQPEAAIPTPIPVPTPAVTFSQTATQRFNELNTRYQEELKKPLAKQEVDDLLKEYKSLQAMENLSPSVKLGTESRVTALEKTAAIQKLIKDTAANDATLTSQREALRQQAAAAEKMIADYQATGGTFIAEGTLQSSTIVKGKYALVNPATGRVVAYVDPKSDIDIGTLVGKYIGIRGTSAKPEDSDLTIIHATSATLMPLPKAGN